MNEVYNIMKNNAKIFKISGMDCPSCAMLIESELEDLGIKVEVSYAKQTLRVQNREDLTKVNKILSGLGYKLEGI